MSLKLETYYKLVAESGEITIGYFYMNPDADCLGFGFNTADGGGFLPEWDLTKTTKVIELEFKEVKDV